jgi:hypothetical protein
MTRTIVKVLVLGTLAVGGLVLTGCQSSSSQPHSLTGSDEMRERQRFTDDRGVYHPDWRRGINTPPGR